MDAREANRATIAVYERHAQTYLDAHGGITAQVAALLDRVAAAAPGGTVLELGSGPGTDALEMERRGLTVRRTDATAAFVERLRAAGHPADLLDAATDPLGGPYDVLFADAVLLHLDRDTLAELLQRATEAATWLAFTVKDGDGDAWSQRKLGEPRWFVYWREAALREVLTRTGWRVEWLARDRGRFDDWLRVLAVRA